MKLSQVRINQSKIKSKDIEAFRELKPDFALLFADIDVMKDTAFLTQIQDLIGNTPIAGCSTAGEITSKGSFSKTAVLQGIKWDKADSKVKIVSTAKRDFAHDYSHANQLAKELIAEDLRAVLVFAPSVNADPPGIVRGIKEAVGANVMVAGGLAGDGGNFKSSLVFANGEVISEGLVLVGIYGKSVQVGHGAAGGWKSFGGIREVTKSGQNMVFEIDNRPALEVYKEALGEHASQLPANGLMFPFALLSDKNEELGLIRAVFTVDEEKKSILLAGDIATGTKIKFMRATNNNLVDGAKDAALKAKKGSLTSSLVLCISCVARKFVMGEAIDDEIVAVQETFGADTGLVGFYAHGEIGPFFTSTDCQLHNQTMTVAVISEN